MEAQGRSATHSGATLTGALMRGRGGNDTATRWPKQLRNSERTWGSRMQGRPLNPSAHGLRDNSLTELMGLDARAGKGDRSGNLLASHRGHGHAGWFPRFSGGKASTTAIVQKLSGGAARMDNSLSSARAPIGSDVFSASAAGTDALVSASTQDGIRTTVVTIQCGTAIHVEQAHDIYMKADELR